MKASGMSPGEESEGILERAEMMLGENRSRCVRSAIQKAGTCDAMEFQVRIGERSMTFRLPHKATMTRPTKSGSRPHPNDEIRIKRIQRFIDAVSSSGLAALLTISRRMPSIKAGDKIRVRI